MSRAYRYFIPPAPGFRPTPGKVSLTITEPAVAASGTHPLPANVQLFLQARAPAAISGAGVVVQVPTTFFVDGWWDQEFFTIEGRLGQGISADDYFSGAAALRQESVVWTVLDRDLNVIGELMVDRDHAPTITNDVDRAIRRTVTGMTVTQRPVNDPDPQHIYARDLEPLTMRIAPYWAVAGELFPLGVFMFTDDSAKLFSWGQTHDVQLGDQMALLDQPLDKNVGFDAGYNVAQAMIKTAAYVGITADRINVESNETTLTYPVAWVAGRDSRRAVLESLCDLVGYLLPYFDNNGVLVCRNAPNLDTAEPDFEYGWGTVVVEGSIVLSNDLLTAPNQYIVVDSQNTGQNQPPLVGRYSVPAAAPNSFEKTGRTITKVTDFQGVVWANLDTLARALAGKDPATYSWIGFDTPPDPRHDTFDVIGFDGINFLQRSWSLQCRAGGQMTHDGRGTYNTEAQPFTPVPSPDTSWAHYR